MDTAAPPLVENLGAREPVLVGQAARLEECFGWDAAAQGAAELAARHLARMGSVPVGTPLLLAEPEEENCFPSLKLENPGLPDQRLVRTLRNHHHHRRKPWLRCVYGDLSLRGQYIQCSLIISVESTDLVVSV